MNSFRDEVLGYKRELLMKIRIIRSKKRRKTIQAREIDGVLEVLAPAPMSDKQLEPVIDNFRKRINRRMKLSKLDDQSLERRAGILNRQYFDNLFRWECICWVGNQNRRYGSCRTDRRTIRISHRIAEMPRFVQDYVIIHELAHLAEPNHSKRFWEMVYQYPKTERARGYLMAVGVEEKT